jgi:hypothetical protein
MGHLIKQQSIKEHLGERDLEPEKALTGAKVLFPRYFSSTVRKMNG